VLEHRVRKERKVIGIMIATEEIFRFAKIGRKKPGAAIAISSSYLAQPQRLLTNMSLI
jgi:hypothetical protein